MTILPLRGSLLRRSAAGDLSRIAPRNRYSFFGSSPLTRRVWRAAANRITIAGGPTIGTGGPRYFRSVSLPNVRNITGESKKAVKEGLGKKVLVLLGGTTQTALHLTKEWLKKGSEYRVVICSRKKELPKRFRIDPEIHPRVQLKVVCQGDYQSSEKMKKHFQEIIGNQQGEVDTLAGVSFIGEATPSKEATLEDMNVKPIVNMAKAIKDMAKLVNHVGIVDIGSIAARDICPRKCSYVESRLQAQRELQEVATSIKEQHSHLESCIAITIRPGVILTPYEHRPFGPDQLTRIVKIGERRIGIQVGSGKQPLSVVSAEDLAAVIGNVLDMKGCCIRGVIDAGGPRHTMEELSQFYSRRQGGVMHTFYLPHRISQWVGRNAPIGRIAEYSGLYMECLDIDGMEAEQCKEFDQLLGRPARTLEDIYPQSEPMPIHYPPVGELIRKSAKVFWKSSVARRDLVKIMLAEAGPMIGSIFRGIMGREARFSHVSECSCRAENPNKARLRVEKKDGTRVTLEEMLKEQRSQDSYKLSPEVKKHYRENVVCNTLLINRLQRFDKTIRE